MPSLTTKFRGLNTIPSGAVRERVWTLCTQQRGDEQTLGNGPPLAISHRWVLTMNRSSSSCPRIHLCTSTRTVCKTDVNPSLHSSHQIRHVRQVASASLGILLLRTRDGAARNAVGSCEHYDTPAMDIIAMSLKDESQCRWQTSGDA